MDAPRGLSTFTPCGGPPMLGVFPRPGLISSCSPHLRVTRLSRVGTARLDAFAIPRTTLPLRPSSDLSSEQVPLSHTTFDHSPIRTFNLHI